MKATIKVAALMICLILWVAQEGLAKSKTYQVSPVTNGGSLTGSVLFKGKIPAPIMEDLNKGKNAEFCATHPDTKEGKIRPRHKVVVTNGKLKDTVVFIENIEQGKDWPSQSVNFDFKNCDIFPKVTVVRKAPKKIKTGLVQITNHDPDILHNPHGYSKVGASAKTLFNKPLPNKGDVADVTKNLKRFKMKKDKHFFLQCDQHNFMEADARIIWNPYYAITAKEGSFQIEQIPAGTYRITAWHPYVGEVSQEVTIEAGQKAQLEFQLSGK
jgi:hypothetical protein